MTTEEQTVITAAIEYEAAWESALPRSDVKIKHVSLLQAVERLNAAKGEGHGN